MQFRRRNDDGRVFPLFSGQTSIKDFTNLQSQEDSRKKLVESVTPVESKPKGYPISFTKELTANGYKITKVWENGEVETEIKPIANPNELEKRLMAEAKAKEIAKQTGMVKPEIVKTGSIPEGIAAKPPTAFKTYTEGGQYFEVSEEDFMKHEMEREKRRLEGNLKYWNEKLKEYGYDNIEAVKKAEGEGKHIKKDVQQAMLGIMGTKSRLDNFDSDHNKKYRTQKLHEQYMDNVKKAISTGKPVPQDVIRQYPEFRKAQDNRRRYEKGLHTSFANKSAAVNAVMQAELGYKVKRQDGRAIPDGQIKEIGGDIRTITDVIGDVKDIMLKEDLTIAHTSGKFPFLEGSAAGLYHSNKRVITTGLQIGPWKIKSLAHEFGHFLDYSAGKVNKLGYEVFYSPGGSSWRGKHVKQIKTAVSNEDMNDPLMEKARFKMNGSSWSIKRATEISPEMHEEQKNAARRLKAKLGTYWNAPQEVWARLFEQYIASETKDRDNGAADPIEAYYKMPAYWTKDVFDELKPMVKAEVQRRIQLARGQ